MPPKKNAKSTKSKPTPRKTSSAKDTRKPVKKSAAAKPRGTARKRPQHRKPAPRSFWNGFAKAFILVLLAGGGLLYAVAPRGLDILGLAATDSNVDFVAEIIKESVKDDPANLPGEPASNDSAAYVSGQEPPATVAPAEPDPDMPNLEQSIIRIDGILRRAMDQHGLPSSALHLDDVSPSSSGSATFLFQHLSFATTGTPDEQETVGRAIIKDLADTLPRLSPPAAIQEKAPGTWSISVAGTPTHELAQRGLNSPQSSSPAHSDGPGRLLIVIDDIGESLTAVQSLLALDFPVTLAVWPRSSQAQKSAELAHAAGREVIIHQPMEPVSYPRNKPGPGAVYSRMSAAEIKNVVAENLKLVPYAVGLNNHMGSRVTTDSKALAAVLESLPRRDFFVLDSLTNDYSVFYAQAGQAGFPSLRRDIFLDNVQSEKAILQQLHTAARLAEKRGYAVAIGHPYAQTLAALKTWQKTRNQAIAIVTGRELLEWLAGDNPLHPN